MAHTSQAYRCSIPKSTAVKCVRHLRPVNETHLKKLTAHAQKVDSKRQPANSEKVVVMNLNSDRFMFEYLFIFRPSQQITDGALRGGVTSLRTGRHIRRSLVGYLE